MRPDCVIQKKHPLLSQRRSGRWHRVRRPSALDMRSRPRVASTGEFESFEERKSLGDREHDENSAQGRELAVGLKPPLLPRLRRRASDDGESLHRQRRSFELLVPQGTGRPPRVEIVGSIPRLVHADPRTSGRRSERSLPGLGSSKKRGAVPDYSRALSGDLAQSKPLRGPRHGRLASAESMYKDLILTFAPNPGLKPGQAADGARRRPGPDNGATSEDLSAHGIGAAEVSDDEDADSIKDEAEISSLWEDVSRRTVDFFGEQMDRSLKTSEDVRTAQGIMDELEEWKCMPKIIGVAAKTHLDAITANHRQLAQRESDGISPRTLSHLRSFSELPT